MGDRTGTDKKSPLLRRLLLGGTGVVLFFGIVIFASPYVVPQSIANTTIEKGLSYVLGRPVRINGPSSFTLLPSLSVRAANVVVLGGGPGQPDPERPVLADIDLLDLELGTFALLADKIQLTRLHISTPQIRLVRDGDGAGNWQDVINAAPVAAKPDLAWGWWQDMQIGDVQVTNGRFLFSDVAQGRKISGDNLNLRAYISNATGAGKGISVKGSARVNGEPVEVLVDLGAVEKLLAGSRLPLVAKLSSAFGQIAYQGAIAKRQYLVSDGRFSIEAPDIGRLEKWLGRIFDVAIAGALKITGRLTDNGSRFAMEDLTFLAGKSQVKGKVLIVDGIQGPHISADLYASDFDLAPFLSFSFSQAWPKSLNGSIKFNWQKISYGAVETGPGQIAIALKLNPQRIEMTLPTIELFGGQGRAEMQLATGEGMTSFKGQMQLIRINSALLLENFQDRAMISGDGDLSLDLFSVGSNFGELLAALRGNGNFNVLAGQVHDEVLAEYLIKGSPGSLPFTQLIGSFSVNQGIVKGSDLLLKSPDLSLVGDGAIDLARGAVDIRLQSLISETTKKGEEYKTIRPFRISGTVGQLAINPEEG
ncbi:MAG: AsmA family protein [Rhodospirillales bacterium]|nr:AsmA family protein [Rhodospirillales bacterium]